MRERNVSKVEGLISHVEWMQGGGGGEGEGERERERGGVWL